MSGSLAECAFCRIARGDDSSVEIVAAGEAWLAFFPLNPATPGHTLVIPREHVADLWRADPLLGSSLMRACISVGQAIEGALTLDGMNLITSAGKTAEQSIFHLHLHLVPRWPGDGFGKIWPTGHRYEEADLGDVASGIRSAWSSDEDTSVGTAHS